MRYSADAAVGAQASDQPIRALPVHGGWGARAFTLNRGYDSAFL